MPMGELLKFLRKEASKESLQDFELRQCAERANLRKELIELLDEAITAEAKALFAEWRLQTIAEDVEHKQTA